MSWQITAKSGDRRGVSWVIGDHPLTLGRSLSCDITIMDPTVSRRHCEISREGTRVSIRDLGSRNVTLVNGRIADQCYLEVGDELSLGTDTFILTRAAKISTTTPVPLRCDDTTISMSNAYTAAPANKTEIDQSLEFLGKSESAARLRSEILTAAKTRLNTLITGEAGTGKGLAAQLMHRQSAEPCGAFVSVDCEVIAGGKFSRALLGEEQISENGGRIVEAGLLDQAIGGTLVFREIGKLTEENQSVLARVLRGLTFVRIGSTAEISFQGRVISTSRNNLDKMLQKGLFRSDLLRIIGRQRIQISPLRQRRSDIRALAHHFLNREKSRSTQPLPNFTEEALGFLEELPLRGNALELSQAVTRATRNGAEKDIQSDDFGSLLDSPEPIRTAQLNPLENAEQTLITAIVRQCAGDIARAAKILGTTRLEVERIMRISSVLPQD